MFKNIFKKNKGEVVDLADLQRRGILKRREVQKNGDSEIVDFTSKTEEGSALGFLGSLAGISETKDEGEEFGTTLVDSERKKRLRGILRDMKIDMKNTSNKIYKISERLDLIEKKLERLERRSGYGQ